MAINVTETEATGVLEAPRYSCALGGAYQSVLGLRGAVPILHSGGGCGMVQALGFGWGAGHNSPGPLGGPGSPCTSLLEQHVVFGGEDKLRKLIQSTISLIEGDLYVVIPGCIPSLIGDDVESVVKEFRRQDGLPPILSVKTAGFSGNSYQGYERFLEAVIDQYLHTEPEKEKGLVNILGIVPTQHIFWKGDLKEIQRILESLGLRVNILFNDFAGVEGLKRLSTAELTIVLSPWVGVQPAARLEERFGVPYLVYPGIPIGPKETVRFVRQVGQRLGVPTVLLEERIAAEKREAYQTAEYLADLFVLYLADTHLAVVADSAYAVGVTRFLTNDGGLLPVLVVITDNPPLEHRERIIKELTEGLESSVKPEVIFEVDSYHIHEILKRHSFQMLMASSMEKYLSTEEFQAIHLTISYPAWDRLIVERSYAGFRGGWVLLEDFVSKIARPGF